MDVNGLVLPLDVNFPEPILDALAEYMPDIELRPLRMIDPLLTELDDRDLVQALRQEGYDWLVTNNYKMLRNPAELAAIMRVKLHIFAIEGTGDDPLRATGALLLDLPGAIRKATPDRCEIFWSRPRSPVPQDPWDLFTRMAQHRHDVPTDLYEQVKVRDDELGIPWRERID